MHGSGDEIVIYEAITFESLPRFLSYNTKTKKFGMLHEVEGPESIFRPIGSAGEVSYKTYDFTRNEINNLKEKGIKPINFAKMYETFYKEFDDFLDIEDKYKHLEVVYLLETYQQHKINSTGYPFHHGEHDSGKTRPLELDSFMAYRVLYGIELGSPNVYEAIGFRNEGSCTICEDEAQELSNPKKQKNDDKMTIYRGGYKSGVRVPRIMDGGSSNRYTRYYYAFCCKSFSGYYLPQKDYAFNSRCIPIPYIEGTPKKDEIDKDVDIPRWSKMKKMLLLWRMVTWAEPLPKLSVEVNNRVKEIWKSKIQIASYYEKAYKVISGMALEAQTRRIKSLQNSLEAHIARTVIKLEMENNWGEITFTDIWYQLLISLNVTDVDELKKKKVYVDALGRDVSKTIVGTKLGQSFQGKSDFRHERGRVWRFRKNTMQRLAKRYGITKESCEH